MNAFLRGWAGYFRYGDSARHLRQDPDYALARLALFVAKRHKKPRSYGWLRVAYQSPDRIGLINLNRTAPGASRLPDVDSVPRLGQRENRCSWA